MKTIGLALAACFLALALSAAAQESAAPPAAPAHVLVLPAEIKWSPGPPSLPKGAQLVVLSGDPSKPAPFAVRLKFPAGFKVAPHWHPTDEHVTVISGTMLFGMGDSVDVKAQKSVGPGGYSLMPAEMHHYASTKTGAVVQVHGVGPFAVTYVNPADDPRTAKPAQ